MCKRPNRFFDPKKPARLERMMEQKFFEKIKREILEGTESLQALYLENIIEEKLRDKIRREILEENILSQACLNDGEFEKEIEEKSDHFTRESSEEAETSMD